MVEAITNKKKAEEDMQETPFNMAMLFYIRLNDLLGKRDEAATLGQPVAWYRYLRAIYRNIKFKLDEKQVKAIQKEFDAALNLLRDRLEGESKYIQQVNNSNVSEAEVILDKIDSELLIYMGKHNMIFPKIISQHGLKNIRKKLGLGFT